MRASTMNFSTLQPDHVRVHRHADDAGAGAGVRAAARHSSAACCRACARRGCRSRRDCGSCRSGFSRRELVGLKPDLHAMPELPDITVYLEALESRHRRADARARGAQESVPAAHGRSAAAIVRRSSRRGAAARRQAHRDRLRQRSLAGDPPDDRRTTALVRQGSHAAQCARRCCSSSSTNGTLTLTEAGTKRRASLHVVAQRGAAARSRSRRPRSARRRPASISRAPDANATTR